LGEIKMAIHCDVCGIMLMSAQENEGSFPAPNSFTSKSPYSNGKNRIDNSCIDCGNKLNTAILEKVSETINNIRSK
jgi:hypothetical protein